MSALQHASAASGLDSNARLRLVHLDFRKTLANLLLKPRAGGTISMAEENRSRIHASDELHHIIAIGVGCQIKILNFAVTRQFPSTLAEEESLSGPGSLQPPAGRVRIRIANKENRVFRLPDHAQSHFVRSCL